MTRPVNDVIITCADWDSPEQLELRRIREAVFIREQNVPPELEWDDDDLTAMHLIARTAAGAAVGVGRMLPDGHIGRVAVLPAYRRRGIATALMNLALDRARERGLTEVWLNAQLTALPVYERLGFIAEGDEFLDAGIPHRRMRLRLE